MIVSGTKPCRVYFDSMGGVARVVVEKRPTKGQAVVEGSITVVYRAQLGYIGRDSFVYAMHAYDRRGAQHVVRIGVDVDVRR